MAVPVAPTLLIATPGDTSASIMFTLDVQDPVVTDIEYALDAGAWVSGGVTEAPLEITGLTNGTEYSVVLRAVNLDGNGAESDPVLVTPSTVPDAPAAVVVTPSTETASVAFTVADGGSAVTDIEFSLDGAAFESAGGATSPIELSGLTNNVSYTVALKAVNANGTSASSAVVSFYTTDDPADNRDGFNLPTVFANAGAATGKLDWNDPDD